MKTVAFIGIRSWMVSMAILISILVPISSWASVEVDGIYYDLNTSAKTAAVASHPDKYSGGVFIPESFEYNGSTYQVTSIGSTAFLNCAEMIDINMPSSVTTIAPSAFERCTGLTTLYIGKGVTMIDYEAFNNCSNLTTLFLPASVNSIGNQTFAGCTSLSEIIVERTTAPTIVSTTFNGVDKAACKVYVPEGYKTAYTGANYWKTFSNIVERTVVATGVSGCTYTIYSDMTMVISGTGGINSYYNGMRHVFFCQDYQNKIRRVFIEEGVTYIGDWAFYCTSLTSIAIPNSVTFISESAFEECRGLTSIVIPNSVTSIFEHAFLGCTGLTSIVIPSSVTIICDDAFEDCTGLTSISVASGNTMYDSRDNCNAIIESSTNTLLSGCQNTIIPNSVTSIGEYAFSGRTGLTSIEIPNSVTSIGSSVFNRCTGLTSIEIPNSVTNIGYSAFYGCTGLTSITVGWETPLTIDSYVFYNIDKSTCTLYVPFGTKSAYESTAVWSDFQNIVELDTDLSALTNAIYVNQTEGRIGGTMDIPVKMKNDYDVRGFQFTMELPEGVVINSWALSTDRLPSGVTTSDKMASQSINGNKIVVVCSLNYGNATFTGNDGEIATVNVTFSDDMEAGSYPIYLTACASNDASGFYNPELSDVKATLVLEDYLPGDANGDGKVMVGDVTAILNYIVGSVPDGFNAKAADVNGDGKVMVGDVTAVLNIIVNQ